MRGAREGNKIVNKTSSTSGVQSRPIGGAREDNIVVKILEYRLIRDELDFSKGDQSDHSNRVESNAIRDSRAWLALEPPQKQRLSQGEPTKLSQGEPTKLSQERPTQILSQGRPIQKLSQGGLTKRTVFNDTIAKMVKAIAVVHLEKGEPIGAP